MLSFGGCPQLQPETAAHFIFFRGIWSFLRTHLLTRENVWVVIVAVMILLILLLGATSAQPRFVYGGF